MEKREYQGFTVAVPREKQAELKAIIRQFFDDLEAKTDGYDKPNTLIRIQLCLFNLLKTELA